MPSRIFNHLTSTIVAVALGFGASLCYSQSLHVRQVEIRSGWGGLGTHQNTEFTIRSDQGGYRLGHKHLDGALVDALVTSIQATAIAKPELQNLGITSGWLAANAAERGDRGDEAVGSENCMCSRSAAGFGELIGKPLKGWSRRSDLNR